MLSQLLELAGHAANNKDLIGNHRIHRVHEDLQKMRRDNGSLIFELKDSKNHQITVRDIEQENIKITKALAVYEV